MKELYWIVLKSILSNTFHRRKGQGRHEGVKIRIFTFFISTSAGVTQELEWSRIYIFGAVFFVFLISQYHLVSSPANPKPVQCTIYC